jgi:hypothetical protein
MHPNKRTISAYFSPAYFQCSVFNGPLASVTFENTIEMRHECRQSNNMNVLETVDIYELVLEQKKSRWGLQISFGEESNTTNTVVSY